MDVPAPVVLGVIAAVAALVIGLAVADRRHRAARLEALRRDAAQRGWRVEAIAAPREGRRITRWTGTGLDGAWTAEAVEHVRKRGREPKVLRWWNAAADAPPPTGPIVVLLDLDGAAMPDLPLTEGRLAAFAEAAARSLFGAAFERNFGPALALKGRTLDRVQHLGPLTEGFEVLSDHPGEAARRLTPAAWAAIRQVCDAPVWAALGAKRPWIGLCGDRLAVAAVGQRLPEGAQVAALVDAASHLVGTRG